MLLLSLSAALLLGDDLQADSRLAKAITLKEVTVSLETVTEDLSKALSIKIVASQEIKDRKATVIVKDRKAADTMSAISDALMLEWKKDGEGYRLQLTETARNIEKQQFQFEMNQSRALITAWAKRVGQYEEYPSQLLEEMMTEASNRLRADEPGLTLEIKKQLTQKIRDIGNPMQVGLACLLNKGGPNVMDPLINGDWLYASTDPADKWLPFSKDHLYGVSNGRERSFGTSAQLKMRYVRGTRTIIVKAFTRAEMQDDTVPLPFTISLVNEGEQKLGPLEQFLAKWTDATKGDELLAKPVEYKPETFPKSGYRSGCVSVSEHLAYLAENAKIDIVSDAFRQATPVFVPTQAATVAKYIDYVAGSPPLPSEFRYARPRYVHAQNGFLMVRHGSYWDLNRTEIPERLLLPLESKIEKTGTADIEDYAALAVKLQPQHLLSFDTYSMPLFRFSKLPFLQCLGSLRLWANLNRSQKGAASGSGLKMSELSGPQRAFAADAMADMMWHTTLTKAAAQACITGGFDPGQVAFTLTLADRTFGNDPEVFPDKPGSFLETSFVNGPQMKFTFAFPEHRPLVSIAWLDKKKGNK